LSAGIDLTMAKEEIEPKEAPLSAGIDMTMAKEEIEPKEAL